MILTCPECATRYFVEDSRLAGEGRTVRCASCKSSWHAQATEPLELTSSETEGAVARETLTFKADEPVGVAAPELPRVFRAKAEARRRVKEAAAAGAVWAGMVSVFAAILVAAYVFRVDVVKLYPRAAGAYAFARVPVNPTGLEFERVKAEPTTAGLPSVVITGQVRNVEDAAAPPPPLRVSLLDARGRKMRTQLVRLPNARIAPGKAVGFTATLEDPEGKAGDVAVEFALDLMPAPSRARPKPKPKPSRATLRPGHATPHAAAAPSAPRPGTPGLRRIGLRPTQGVPEPAPVEARPLPATDPYAIDTRASRAVSAVPHG
jgi:predicted Zn finger-like uncharacterized protein